MDQPHTRWRGEPRDSFASQHLPRHKQHTAHAPTARSLRMMEMSSPSALAVLRRVAWKDMVSPRSTWHEHLGHLTYLRGIQENLDVCLTPTHTTAVLPKRRVHSLQADAAVGHFHSVEVVAFTTHDLRSQGVSATLRGQPHTGAPTYQEPVEHLCRRPHVLEQLERVQQATEASFVTARLRAMPHRQQQRERARYAQAQESPH